MVNPGYESKPEWFKNSFLDIREDVADAASQGKRVALYFYQDGCPYCSKLLRENFALRDLAEKTRRHFDVIAINMWGDREVTDFSGNITSEKRFAADLRVMFTPTFLFLAESGDVTLRLNGYYPPHKFDVALDYAAGDHEQGQRFAEYQRLRSPSPASGELHLEDGFITAPGRLDTGSGRPLLVLFEQKQCPACDELHRDILRRPPVRAAFEAFDVALLDVWSTQPVTTPDGRRLPVTDWAARLDLAYVPSMLFFDPSGREVFRTEAYLRSFHVHAALDYVRTGAYLTEPSFQRFVQERAERLRGRGIDIDLMD